MLVLAVVVFSITADRFLAPANLSLIVQQVMVVGTLGIAQTLDHPDRRHRPLGRRDHGALVDRDGQAVGRRRACPGLLALLIGFVVGTACGLLNGALVTRLRLPPFIVTLGTLNIFFALNLYVLQERDDPRHRHVEPAAVDGQDDRTSATPGSPTARS